MGPAAGGSDLAFPHGWVWGTATAAHQIEGGNVNNDWWAFEHDPASGCAESSGDACDSWHRWPEDLDLVKGMGLGAYRFSVEWSRIEPARGEFSQAALDHYRRMCEGCLERGITPVVTFHHFTTPRGWPRPAPGCCPRPLNASGILWPAPPSAWATCSGGPAPSTSPARRAPWATWSASTPRASGTTTSACWW